MPQSLLVLAILVFGLYQCNALKHESKQAAREQKEAKSAQQLRIAPLQLDYDVKLSSASIAIAGFTVRNTGDRDAADVLITCYFKTETGRIMNVLSYDMLKKVKAGSSETANNLKLGHVFSQATQHKCFIEDAARM